MILIKKIFIVIVKAFSGLLFFLFLLGLLSALYNHTLPEHSVKSYEISKDQAAMIREAQNLFRNKGEDIWPGSAQVSIPVLIYNENYAFITGINNPAKGWTKLPTLHSRGYAWKRVNSINFPEGYYYKQFLPDPETNPENFTVKVGNKWVAAIQTKEYAEIAFYIGFSKELPPYLSFIFPYRIFWNILMGKPEFYISGIIHEMFHAYQGIRNEQKLFDAESITNLETNYPWHENNNMIGWEQEINILIKACETDDINLAKAQAKKFISKRNERRQKANLLPDYIKYEKQREWLEGLAKYSELTFGLTAGKDPQYLPIIDVFSVKGFNRYHSMEKYRDNQLAEAGRAAGHFNDNRFYYTGMLQALLLDKISSEWKNHIFKPEIYLDDLIEKAINI